MNAYRLKHKPTGLYFKPNRGTGNLSEKGKLYVSRIPSMEWVDRISLYVYPYKKNFSKVETLVVEFFGSPPANSYSWWVKTPRSDWEIETMGLIEGK